MKAALTSNEAVKACIKGLKAETTCFDHGHDEAVGGFGLRLRASGRMLWVYQYKFEGLNRRMTIGDWPALKLEQARSRARKLRDVVYDVEDPKDPWEEREKKREAKVKEQKLNKETFLAEATKFLDKKKEDLRPRSYLEVERHMMKHAESLHGRTLASIDRAVISKLLSQIKDDSGPVAANRTRATLSAFFAWAMRSGTTVVANPVLVDRNKEEPRERVLSDGELAEVWHALDDSDYGAIVKLLMLTGQRRDEIASLRWDEIDFEQGVIVLPPARTKNKLRHEVPMSDAISAILKERAETRVDDRDLVFGKGEGGYSGWSTSKESLDQRIAEARGKALGKKATEMPHWTLHDLRRSFVTGLGNLGVLPHVIEATVNHVSGFRGGVAGVYQRAEFTAEKTAAMVMWADHLMSIVSDTEAKVISMNRIPA
jgi:integrase